MYKLLGTPRSRAFRVMWMLEELGQPYELLQYGPRSEEVKAHNPSGKIPVLLDGDAVLTDSVGIMTYLADKTGQLTAPAGTHARAHQDAVTLWLVDDMDGLLFTFSKHSFILPEEYRVPAIGPILQSEFEVNLQRLEEKVQDGYIMGDAFTVPDILAVHCLRWAKNVGFPEAGPATKDYIKRCSARDGFKSATEKAVA